MNDMTRQQIDEAVTDCLRRFCSGVDDIRPVDDLQDDLGIDSIEMVELAAMLSKQCGIGSRRIDLDGVATVGELGDRLERSLRTEPGMVSR